MSKVKSQVVRIDGQDGGGQILRTALSLSMITGKPFRMVNIRGKRRKPGLMRQHLTCVNASAQISNAATDGAAIGSTELTFEPQEIVPGNYYFSIGTAGSTTLLLQTLLPALWQADEPSTLNLEGGTHNPLAPPLDFIERVFLPAVQRIGFYAEVTLDQIGFAPVGGGRLSANVTPAKTLKKVSFEVRGELQAQKVTGLSCNLDPKVAQRMSRKACNSLGWKPGELQLVERNEGPSKGACCIVEAHFENVSELVIVTGSKIERVTSLGESAAAAMESYLVSSTVVGTHLADQLLLPMALAGGGSFLTSEPDDHLRTNIATIEAFLDVEVRVEKSAQSWSVTVG